MTTIVPFQPSAAAPFQFAAVLDGNPYNVSVTWNFYAQRWYANINAIDGTLVVAKPIVGSSNHKPLSSLTWALFPTGGRATANAGTAMGSVIYSPASGSTSGTIGGTAFFGAPALDFSIGSIVQFTISGAKPSGFNGTFDCTITGPDTFTYPLAVAPSLDDLAHKNLPTDISPINPGSFGHDVSIVDGYFTSTLIYRPMNAWFEINP